MASSYTTSLGLELQATGENRASWGSKTNTNLSLIEEAISGLKTIAMTDANLTLTKINAGTDQSRPVFLRFTGGPLTADRTVTIPTVSKFYFMQNTTTGGKNLSISTGSSSYLLAPGQWKLVFTSGSTLWTSDDLFSASSATRRWDTVGATDATGIMEVGKAIDFHNANADATDFAVRLETGGYETDLYITPAGSTGKKVWHAGNDGPASGLNADLLDGLHAVDIGFPTGTSMLFWQTAAPTGWVKSTAHTNKALRVTSGTISSGGTLTFTGAFTDRSSGATALTAAQIPAHAHTFSDSSSTESAEHTHTFSDTSSSAGAHTHSITNLDYRSGFYEVEEGGGWDRVAAATGSGGAHTHTISGTTSGRSAAHYHTVSGTTSSIGSSGSHTHTLDMDVQYIDVIIATKG